MLFFTVTTQLIRATVGEIEAISCIDVGVSYCNTPRKIKLTTSPRSEEIIRRHRMNRSTYPYFTVSGQQGVMSRSSHNPSDQEHQERQTLALEWLERQHQAQQNRQSLNDAILSAVATVQQQQQLSLPGIRDTFGVSSSSPDLRNQPYLLDQELQRHLIQQQHLQSRDNIQLGQNNSILQQRLSQMLLGGEMALQDSGVAGRNLSNLNNTDNADLDRLMAAETLLQQSRLQEAVRMLQMQGAMQGESFNHGNIDLNNNLSGLGSSGLMIPNEPIIPHSFTHLSTSNSSPYVNHLLQSGLLNVGQVLPISSSFPSVADDFQSTQSTGFTKRKSDSSQSTSKETTTKKPKSKDTRQPAKSYSFPVPSSKRSRDFAPLELKSLQQAWDELDKTPLQKEIFLRRLCKEELHLMKDD